MSAARPTKPTASSPSAASPLNKSPNSIATKKITPPAMTTQIDHGYSHARYGRGKSGSRRRSHNEGEATEGVVDRQKE